MLPQSRYGVMKSFRGTLIFHQAQNRLLRAYSNSMQSSSTNINDTGECQKVDNPQPRRKVKTVLAIHTGVNAICWSMLNSNYELLAWSYESFLNIPANTKLLSLAQMAHNICTKMPVADEYVMDQLQKYPCSNKKKVIYLELTQRQYLYTILLSYILKKNQDLSTFNDVHLMNPKVIASFFQLLVGQEIASTKEVVQKLLTGGYQTKTRNLIVLVNKQMINQYTEAAVADQEQMNYALLMSVVHIFGSMSNDKSNR